MSPYDCFAGGVRPSGDARPGWCDHELWQQACAGERSAPIPEKPLAALVAAEPGGRVPDDPAERLVPVRRLHRREIGRSLFRTFDTARRRCGRGTAIRLGGV